MGTFRLTLREVPCQFSEVHISAWLDATVSQLTLVIPPIHGVLHYIMPPLCCEYQSHMVQLSLFHFAQEDTE